MSSPKHLPGIWTPWAELLCYPCHGSETRPGNPIEGFEVKCDLRDSKDSEAKGYCDKCGATIWLDESLAAEQSVIVALKDNELGWDRNQFGMMQTGGMCSAVGVNFDVFNDQIHDTEGRIVCVTDDEDAEEGFVLGLYENEDGLYEGDPMDDALCRSPAEVVAQVRLWAGLSEDLMLGFYNASADARRLIREVEAEPRAGSEDGFDDLLEETLEDEGREALGYESRGDTLAIARFLAMKSEIERIES